MDMIERAARAIFACNCAPHEEQEVIDQMWGEWPSDRRKAERQARAVLAEMREPDEGMLKVAYLADENELTAYDSWQAMIDQALKG